MGVMDFLKQGVAQLAISRPAAEAGKLVYRHGTKLLPPMAQLTVAPDEVCVLVRDGQPLGTFEPGRHTLSESSYPFLDRVRSAGGYQAEAWFVRTAVGPALAIGGMLPSVVDPATQVIVRPMLLAKIACEVVDAPRFVEKVVGHDAEEAERALTRALERILVDRVGFAIEAHADFSGQVRAAVAMVEDPGGADQIQDEIKAELEPLGIWPTFELMKATLSEADAALLGG